jgi:mannose-1-phosphate guanylyltransferase
VTDDAAGAWAVVPAGGEGMRLRSVTCAIVGDDRPKQYVPLIGADSLLRQTMARAARLSPRERTLVVSQQHHAGWLAADLGAHREPKLLLQPENRDTAAGVPRQRSGEAVTAHERASVPSGSSSAPRRR